MAKKKSLEESWANEAGWGGWIAVGGYVALGLAIIAAAIIGIMGKL